MTAKHSAAKAGKPNIVVAGDGFFDHHSAANPAIGTSAAQKLNDQQWVARHVPRFSHRPPAKPVA